MRSVCCHTVESRRPAFFDINRWLLPAELPPDPSHRATQVLMPRYEGEKVDRNPSQSTMLSSGADDQEILDGLHSILGMNNIHTQNTMKTEF